MQQEAASALIDQVETGGQEGFEGYEILSILLGLFVFEGEQHFVWRGPRRVFVGARRRSVSM